EDSGKQDKFIDGTILPYEILFRRPFPHGRRTLCTNCQELIAVGAERGLDQAAGVAERRRQRLACAGIPHPRPTAFIPTDHIAPVRTKVSADDRPLVLPQFGEHRACLRAPDPEGIAQAENALPVRTETDATHTFFSLPLSHDGP